jgi:hypothetical protein
MTAAQWPSLPTRSERNASYQIDAELEPTTKLIRATEVLLWRNTSAVSVSDFYFHLYLNAYKNNRSTFALEQGGIPEEFESSADQPWGFCRVDRIRLLANNGELLQDLTAAVQFVQPDDGNVDDQTVFRVPVDRAVLPGETARFEIRFTSQLPPAVDRSGYTRDFFFVAQWYPKIGVLVDGRWNCHQFHGNSEFFADFGNYDVRLTVPAKFQIGATGRQLSRVTTVEKVTYRFQQDDVHDFAWAASPDFRLFEWVFTWPDLHPVQLRLFLQPEHAGQSERHLTAAAHALRYHGEWYGEYPYDTFTIIDPPHDSPVGGMEYPTLITAGTSWWAPAGVHAPEGVVVHESGHQFWYGLVANNEFEEAWLDEGITTYCTAKVLQQAYGQDHYVRRFFGGLPLVLNEFGFGRHEMDLAALRRAGSVDVMARNSWEYLGTYGLNSYSKPAIVLQTLERLLGDEPMKQALRGYQHRWRFRHPTTADFIAALNEFSGRDLNAFFQQTFFSNGVLDYSVHSISNRDELDRQGSFDDAVPPASGPVGGGSDKESPAGSPRRSRYIAEVVVRRLGELRWPVDLLLRFEDGRVRYEVWDGAYTWKRYSIPTDARIVEAILDPDQKLLLDIDRTNNSKRLQAGDSWAARKWGIRWLFWFQHLLEVFALPL